MVAVRFKQFLINVYTIFNDFAPPDPHIVSLLGVQSPRRTPQFYIYIFLRDRLRKKSTR